MIWNPHSQTKGPKRENQAPEDQEAILIINSTTSYKVQGTGRAR